MENNLVPLDGKMLPSKNSEEKFELARQSRKIMFSTEEEIRQALRYAMAKIGLRGENIPKGATRLLLIQHVFDNFGENRVDEIKLAFDWGIEGRLDEDINCFENFSCLYFTRIMRAYNRLAWKVRSELEPKPKEIKHIAPAPKEEPKIEDNDAWERFKQSGFAEILRKNGIQIPK